MPTAGSGPAGGPHIADISAYSPPTAPPRPSMHPSAPLRMPWTALPPLTPCPFVPLTLRPPNTAIPRPKQARKASEGPKPGVVKCTRGTPRDTASTISGRYRGV